MIVTRRSVLALAGTCVAAAQLAPTDLNRVVAGIPAPDFTLPTGDDRSLTLSHFRGGNVVLVFYRGHW